MLVEAQSRLPLSHDGRYEVNDNNHDNSRLHQSSGHDQGRDHHRDLYCTSCAAKLR
jgi:hypothetical protein